MEIGKRLKELRLQRDLTQEELAQRSELTKGYISQLENDIASPSISTLVDILTVMGVSLQTFFSDIKEEKIVFTEDDFFESKNNDGTNTWLVPNSQKNLMEPIILELPEGGSSEIRAPFEGEEFGYVLMGKIKIDAGDFCYKAKKGDAFYLNGMSSHSITNVGRGSARIIWITTPSNF